MKHFGAAFLFFAIVTLMTSLYAGEARHGNHKEHNRHHNNGNHHHKRITGDEVPEPPRVILRKYNEYLGAPENLTVVYHSIPVTLEHIKDDTFYLTAPYYSAKTTFLSIHLWMEFSDIKKSDGFPHNEFLIEIIPIIGSRVMAAYDDDCSLMTIVSKTHFPEDILEMKFDVTSLYLACQAKDESSFLKYKIRFYPLNNTTNINLMRDKVNMFFLFKEEDDNSDIQSYHSNSEDFEPLNYHTIMAHARRRVKRSLKQRHKAPKTCSLRPYTFNFDYSGLKSIIAPKAYRVNKCHGRCAFPLAPHLNYTNYAVVKAIASTIYKEMKNPSCVAQDLAPLMMLTITHNKYTVKRQHDMVVTSCRCC